jgi:threonine dehydrogenase-like Zn-dependent dehydrogenase
MRANTWSGRNSVEVRDVPDPKILNNRDAIVRITSTAICGSDLHLVDCYVPTMKDGDVLGHEFMGEVVRSDGAPWGKRARKEFPQRPAQPLSEADLAKGADA